MDNTQGNTQGTTPGNTQKYENEWGHVMSRMRSEYGEDVCRRWLRPLTIGEFIDGQVVLQAPSKSCRDWVENHFGERLLTLWRATNPKVFGLAFSYERNKVQNPLPSNHKARLFKMDRGFNVDKGHDSQAPRPQLDSHFTFENFMVSPSNELALAAAKRVAFTAHEAGLVFNPLFLWGGVGLGKTHLMQAIAAHVDGGFGDKKVLYMSAEHFMYKFVRSLRTRDTIGFKEDVRSADIFLIDDIQFILGKKSTQEEFFHTFNALIDQKKQVIVSADRPPCDLQGFDERMRSRLSGGLVVEVGATDYDLRLAILKHRLKEQDVHFASGVLEFVANKITANVREIEGALNRLIAYGELMGRQMSLEKAQESLRDLIRTNNYVPDVSDIQRQVSLSFNIKVSQMLSSSRQQVFARPRQVAMYLCKEMTQMSLFDIGRAFGKKDHTTVLHAVKRVESLVHKEASFSQKIIEIRQLLQNQESLATLN